MGGKVITRDADALDPLCEFLREVLEQMTEKWARAKRLRSFTRACEKILKNGANGVPADGWELKWLAWAREHADRMDPISNGYLKTEKERLCTNSS